jgi:Uma2 family endonuclease
LKHKATKDTKINIYLDKNLIAYASGADGGFIMLDGSKLMPDVGYISKENMPEIPAREASDLAVEVVSPSDDVKDVQRKAQRYLNAGTKIVWIVYPSDESLDVCTPAETNKMTVQQLDIEGILDAADVLATFKLPLREIFHGL